MVRQLKITLCCSQALSSSVKQDATRKDLFQRTKKDELKRHKLKRLVQHPNSFFMDLKCPGCTKITTTFSHASTVVSCVGWGTVLCQPTGGKARLVEGCKFRKKPY